MILTPADEYFTHQIPLPHSVVGSTDPAWRERYVFNIHDVRDQDTMIVCGVGQYPNQDTQEAFVCLTQGKEQRNLRLSRTLLPNRDRVTVGPFRVDVEEPLRRLRLVLDENESGVTFDLTFDATMHPGLEELHFDTRRGRVTHDLIRYQQVGRCSGTLDTGDGAVDVGPDRFWATRDHSWGLRPIPHMIQGVPPAPPQAWKFLWWAPLQFESFALHLYLYEFPNGKAQHLSAILCSGVGGDDEPVRIVDVQHELAWDTTAPALTLDRGRLLLTTEDGTELSVELLARPARGYLRGGGYGGWGDWYQGNWKGDDSSESETWDLSDAAMLRRYVKHSSDHLVEARCNGETGFGIVEYMVFPGYHRYPEVQG